MADNAWGRTWNAIKILGLPLVLRSLRYSVEKRYAELKFKDSMHPRGGLRLLWTAWKTRAIPLPKPPPLHEFEHPGAVKTWYHIENTLTINAEVAAIQLTAVAPCIIQIRLNAARAGFPPAFSYAIADDDGKMRRMLQTRVEETPTHLLFKTEILSVKIHRADSRIDFLDARGSPVNLAARAPSWHENWVGMSRNLTADTPVFGLGEHGTSIDLRGDTFPIWATDPGGKYSQNTDPLYQAHPWFINFTENRAFGIFLDNTFLSYFDFGKSNPEQINITANGGELRYYFIYGPELKTVLARFSDLTGKMPLPPLWTLGYQQSRWSYKNESQVRELAAQFRAKKIPCDVIHLDIHYMRGYRVFSWHPKRFPKPAEMIKDLRPDGFRFIAIIDPAVKADRLYDVAEDGLRQNVFVTLPDGKQLKAPVWAGDSYFPDFTNPVVRIWWGTQLKKLTDTGIAAFWTDMNEPAVFSAGEQTLPDVMHHDFDGHFANHAEAHNIYGMQMARATFEAQAGLRPQRRPFVLTRSGFSGIQRYAAVWTGDNSSTWAHLKLSLSMVLQLGLSGVPFSGADIGGFGGTPTPELFARWMQLGAFFPLFRVHSAQGTPRQEPWSFGTTVEKIARDTIELRYRLLPYFYTVLQEATQAGIPVVRPMLLNFQDDGYTHNLDDQFMVGDVLLIAPVLTEGAENRRVYLPKGTNWYDYWTGEYFFGGQTLVVETPLAHIPMFIRAGSVLPHWDLLQHTGEVSTLKTIHLHTYLGDGQSFLYEDDGKSIKYRHDEFKHTRFICRNETERIIVTMRQKGLYAPPYETLSWHIHSPEPLSPQRIVADGITLTNWDIGADGTLKFRTPFVQRLEILR